MNKTGGILKIKYLNLLCSDCDNIKSKSWSCLGTWYAKWLSHYYWILLAPFEDLHDQIFCECSAIGRAGSVGSFLISRNKHKSFNSKVRAIFWIFFGNYPFLQGISVVMRCTRICTVKDYIYFVQFTPKSNCDVKYIPFMASDFASSIDS